MVDSQDPSRHVPDDMATLAISVVDHQVQHGQAAQLTTVFMDKTHVLPVATFTLRHIEPTARHLIDVEDVHGG